MSSTTKSIVELSDCFTHNLGFDRKISGKIGNGHRKFIAGSDVDVSVKRIQKVSIEDGKYLLETEGTIWRVVSFYDSDFEKKIHKVLNQMPNSK